jgi:hypothetical protein
MEMAEKVVLREEGRGWDELANFKVKFSNKKGV